MGSKGHATRNDIVDFSSSTMAFNVAKIASARASLTISLTKSLRVAGPLVIQLVLHWYCLAVLAPGERLQPVESQPAFFAVVLSSIQLCTLFSDLSIPLQLSSFSPGVVYFFVSLAWFIFVFLIVFVNSLVLPQSFRRWYPELLLVDPSIVVVCRERHAFDPCACAPSVPFRY